MAASHKSVRATLKIVAVYAFALSTAVACSKFEGNTVIKKGTANGNVSVTRDGATGGAPTEMTVTIDKISTISLGADEFGQAFYNIKLEMSHGAKKLSIDTYPQIAPYIGDKAKKTTGSVEYTGEGICGNDTCTKYGVMITVIDSSNGAEFQRAEAWDTEISTTAPQKRLTQTDFTDLATAYQAMTSANLNGEAAAAQ